MLTPVDAVRHPDPYPYYATLTAELPFAYHESVQAWVAADARSVTAVLGSAGYRVRPTAEPVPTGLLGTAAGDVFGDLVRMTDGPVQQRLKQVVTGALREADGPAVGKTAAERTRASLARGGEPRFEELMFGVPAQVVAALCGLDDGADEEAARLIGDFVQCIPASATLEQQQAAALAAQRLQALLGPGLTAGRPEGQSEGLLGALVRAARREDWSETAPLLANAVGFLSQTYDATAGLIGNSLLALRDLAAVPHSAEELAAVVRETARHDAPIQNTRRFAAAPPQHGGPPAHAEPLRYGDAVVEPGQAVLLLLAAANRDPAVNPDPHAFRPGRPAPAVFTFGAAAHRCPGEELAVAITTGVLAELLAAGFDPASLPTQVAYRPLANARIPVL
ncbi:cytochrome P450 [Kitasatospora sp. MAP12-15]|uniref:cytochrome P450 n=1 Tax=unclassified Kitasatospora TaxID=2633591 RepID=UPI0024767E70|nr:cytochrome P450 [Kitasatospora sp. MAP12-44]MDH6110344.1 cytochrome P450 [Kitasatospora sp. MAP12-44]